MVLTSGTRLGAYEILSPLGAGGMGEVYRARDRKLDREVAIKALPQSVAADPAALARFEREAKAIAALSHPSILAIHDLGKSNGVTYAVMELLEGENLQQRLASGALPQRKAIEIAREIALGLAAAHERGIAHRDLKPANVFLTRDGRVKILDFGLARKLPLPSADATDAPTVTQQTEPGTVLGTVGYMAPEQLRGIPADARSDIFSFGAVLYEMLSGKRAFKGSTSIETMNAILKEDPPEIAESSRNISPALDEIVHHCLQKNPEERFQSARDLAFVLDTLSSHSGAAAVAADRGPRRAALSLPSLVAAVIAFAAVALSIGVLVGRLSARAGPPSFDRVTFRRGVLLSARFGPDGRTILYSASWDGRPPALFIKRPENPDAVPLELPSAVLLAVSLSGELAIQLNPRWAGYYHSRGTLARVALSGGAPREVAEDVTQVDWGPDGRLAAVREVSGKRRLEFPLGKVLYETTGLVVSPRFSPRGDLIAFLDYPFWGGLSGSIAVVDLAGRKRVLSKEWNNVTALSWATPDEIWFTAAGPWKLDPGPPDRSLYAVTLSGKLRPVLRLGGGLSLQDVAASGSVLLGQQKAGIRIKSLAPSAAKEHELSWLQASLLQDLSRDGSTLTLSVEEPGSAFGVYIRKTDGSPPQRLGEGFGGPLSPDGKWVASFRKHEAPLVLLPTGPGEPREIGAPGLDVFDRAWLPDGRHLIFAARAQGRALSRLYVQGSDGGEPRPISPEGIAGELGNFPGGIVPSPDGKIVAALGSDQKAALYPVDGGGPYAVPGAVEGERPLQWSSDGRSLYVARPRELFLPARVFLLDIETGRRTLWKELMPEDPTGFVAITRACVTPDGKAYAYDYYSVLSDLYVVEGLK